MPADLRNRTARPAYTLAVFSKTRYARNGDLRVAYRASPEGARDIVFVPNWFTCCEILPELPPMQGWVDAMTSLGRLIFFDQPWTGASDPVTPGALPTLEQWTDSITAVLDDLGSGEAVLVAVDGAFATGALFAATHPSRTTALVALQGYADLTAYEQREEFVGAMIALWGTAKLQPLMNPDMPWNEEIRSAWARMERLAASPATVALMLPLLTDSNVRAVLPTIRVPTLIVQHIDHPLAPMGRFLAEHIPSAKHVELPGRNTWHFVEPGWRASFQEIAQFLTGQQAEGPMTGFSPLCSSPTSSTRRAGPPRAATATGMRCSMRTTPSSGHSSLAFAAAR
jgi:pimeloyl-ACP methyl ester carboxylesterase